VTIVCLGWGSLIWSPRLPIEFSRQAADGRITLAITPGAAAIPVLWAELAVETLDEAVEALGHREGIPRESWLEHVGVWQPGAPPSDDQAHIIGAWAAPCGYSGVVWAALPTGFKQARGTVPTLEEILAYLRGLTGETRARAEEYIRCAPAQTRTAYREEIEMILGWTRAN
jgi:hypothetical protein